LNVEQWPLERLIEYARNPRKNDHAVEKIAAAIHEFGFRVPILAKSDGLVIDGHLRLKAARKLGMETVPVLLADDMSDNQVRAFRLSVNKMADLAEWDDAMLSLELSALQIEDFDLGLTGFEPGEMDRLMDGAAPDDDTDPGGIDYEEKFSVLVECTSEHHQADVFDQLQGLGLSCKVLVN
jgi:ParB-like chromosome segregation protein Spo0J